MDEAKLEWLRERFGGENETAVHDERLKAVVARVIDSSGKRVAPFAGIPTFLDLPHRQVDWLKPDLSGLDVAVLGIPMDLAISNRNGCRFGPRAVRTIERIGPYNHALKTAPGYELRAADIGDVDFRTRYDLESCHADIEAAVAAIIAAGVVPLSVGGDHSITLPVLRAIGKHHGPVAMVHIDAHCDTGGPFEACRFHHGGPFRHAVLEGVLDPERTIQIGIRGSSETLWEFSYDSGMTVIHAEEMAAMGIEAVIEKARALVGHRPVYVSFDIDSLDPAFAPGTGTPEVGGLTTREAQAILRGLKGMDIIGADVVEVAPQYDPSTNTAHAGAQMLFELLSLIALKAEYRRTP